ncbi:MAG: TetR/AcrR family transcriptional regulator [Oscillospiraceae bacterium]
MKLVNFDIPLPLVTGTMAEKKQQRKKAIINSAYKLFVEKGVGKTSIDDIVKGAKMAKGTFYLYFKDKEELLDDMIYLLCSDAVASASNLLDLEQAKNQNMEIGDSVVFFSKKLFDILFENREMMPIIHKNLSKGLFVFNSPDNSIKAIIKRFEVQFVQLGGSCEEAMKRLYMIVEIVNSVFYNAVMDEKPYKFEEIEPLLLTLIRNMAYPEIAEKRE